MHSIEIVGTDITLEYPESGLEFNRSQFLVFSRLVMLYNAKTISFVQFKTRLTYAFLNLKRTANLEDAKNLPLIHNIMRISKFADAYFNPGTTKEGKVVKMNFYRQLMPTVSVGPYVFHGPTDALFNTAYGEFIQLLSHFNDYSRTGDQEQLDLMVATIYRPKRRMNWLRKYLGRYKSDPRKEFNSELTGDYAKKLAKLPLEVKHAIYLYVASSVNFLVNAEALDIGGGNTANIASIFQKEGGSSKEKGSGLGMVATLYTIAESKVFGAIKEVAEQNTIDVLVYLTDQKHKINENEKRLKNVAVRRPGKVR